MEPPSSPWSRNPDRDAGDDLDVVVGRGAPARPMPVADRTLPGDRMRRGVQILRWCAGVLAAITIVGQALLTYGVDSDDFGPYNSGWPRFGQFLSGIPFGLGFAGLMFAASFIVAAHAARLDLEQSLLPD